MLSAWSARPGRAGSSFVTGPPQAGAAILRTDRLYDARRLRRAVRTGADPESAVIWRLDRAEARSAGRGRADAAADLSAARPVLGLSPSPRSWPPCSSPRGSGPTP